jgi:hypothetical protein
MCLDFCIRFFVMLFLIIIKDKLKIKIKNSYHFTIRPNPDQRIYKKVFN